MTGDFTEHRKMMVWYHRKIPHCDFVHWMLNTGQFFTFSIYCHTFLCAIFHNSFDFPINPHYIEIWMCWKAQFKVFLSATIKKYAFEFSFADMCWLSLSLTLCRYVMYSLCLDISSNFCLVFRQLYSILLVKERFHYTDFSPVFKYFINVTHLWVYL